MTNYLKEVKERCNAATAVYERAKGSEHQEIVEANYTMLDEYCTDVPRLLEIIDKLKEELDFEKGNAQQAHCMVDDLMSRLK